MRQVWGVGCFRRSESLRARERGAKRPGHWKDSGARELPRAPCRGRATVRWEVRRGLVGLRSGESGGREGFWGSRIRRPGRLTGGVARRLGSGCARGARMAVKRVL